jgi:protein SCO1/2
MIKQLPRWMPTLAACAAILGGAGCDKPSAPLPTATGATDSQSRTQVFAVQGVVKELHSEKKSVVIAHEKIPGYMEAMTMPFDVRDTNELARIKPGDKVSFRMLVTRDEGWIDQINVVSTTQELPFGVPPPPARLRLTRIVEPLKIGDLMPSYPLTNELGKAISLGDYRGQALALTFIFTRCPFPNFCPRMSESFAAAYRKLRESPNSATNWHLLTVSFDPEFDTPAVLQAYARRQNYDPNFWTFATGAMIEIDAITEQFGMTFSRDEGSFNFSHNLRTVVVDARGRVQKVFIGNEWKADDLVAEMIKAAEARD